MNELSRSATREATRVSRYQVCYTRYQVSFNLWQVLKHCKVPKYFDQDFLEVCILLSTLSILIQFIGKSGHLAQESSFYQKTTNKKVESFVKSNFDVNQICKIVVTQNRYIWNFRATD